MRRKLALFAAAIFILATLTGCWNRREIETLAIVEAVGIDKAESGEISVTIQILKPNAVKSPDGQGGSGGSSSKAVWTLTSTGATVFDAIRNATKESGRKLFWPFNRLIVFGEDAARSGLDDLLDYFYRDAEPRTLAYCLVAKGKAKDIIEASSEQENIPAVGISDLIESTTATSKIPEVCLCDIQKILSSATQCVMAPGITTREKPKGDITEKYTMLDDTAVFANDNKMIGWIDPKETRGVLWVTSMVGSGIIVVNSPKDENKKISIEIIKASSEIIPEIKDGKLSVTVKIKETGNLGEQMSGDIDLAKPDMIAELEKRQEDVIKDEVYAALDKVQEQWGADVLDFGENIYRDYPTEWKQLEKNWKEEIKNVDVHVEVESTIGSVGMITVPHEYHANNE